MHGYPQWIDTFSAKPIDHDLVERVETGLQIIAKRLLIIWVCLDCNLLNESLVEQFWVKLI